MKIKRFEIGAYGVNCYVISCTETKKAFIIDPGAYTPKLIDYLKENQLEAQFVLLTHAHGDHICGLKQFMSELKIPVYLHEDEFEILNNPALNFSGSICGNNIKIEADKKVVDNEIIKMGEIEIKVLHTPGHTPGGISIQIGKHVFCGDTLFRDSIGRTDFPYSDTDTLFAAIREKLYVLDPNTVAYPGHGAETTIAYEKKANMFVRG